MSEYMTKISNTTNARRKQIKNLQDEFMTFSWGGHDFFEEFGAFIINDKKGSLKFYNGPSFSNEYTKPQFDNNGGELMGVTFNRQTISFTIGVYWIGIEDYRKMLNLLHPLRVDYLSFSFNKQYRYNVKLSKIGDSTRYVIGKEDGDYRYYTELSLSFEVQGTPCAIGLHPYEWKWSNDSNNFIASIRTIDEKGNAIKEFVESDLLTPIEIPLVFETIKIEDSTFETEDPTFEVTLKAQYGTDSKNTITLFNVKFKNLSATTLNLKYYSETGLLFLKYGNSDDRLLNLLNTSDTGEKIIERFTINKFFLPGKFNELNTSLTQLNLTFSGGIFKINESFENLTFKPNESLGIICYPRTNVI